MLHERITRAGAGSVSLAELVGAFSYALDITEGQPPGHCVRACWIGMNLGRALGLASTDLHDLYYTLLLKDLGCSSNAARICELYEADDLAFKRGFKTVGTSLAATLHFVFAKTARASSFGRRAAAVGNILRNGPAIADQMILSRCTRGADIARSLRFSDAVCSGIYSLDEHWDGSGRPDHLSGERVPLFSRIALLSQIADVFHTHAGRQAAEAEVFRRSGTWLDPALVREFLVLAERTGLWAGLESPFLDSRLVALAPAECVEAVDEDYLDAIAAAFGAVVDAKSPYTAGHSVRVADYASSIGSHVGIPQDRHRWLHRAALLHDIGKLGVSNMILDKPGKLDDAEWDIMRKHASHTNEILGRTGALADLAPVASAHHERLDGRGYPLGLKEAQIPIETRIITICDFYDALTADRPYRGAMPLDEAFAIIGTEVGRAIDQECFEGLRAIVGK